MFFPLSLKAKFTFRKIPKGSLKSHYFEALSADRYNPGAKFFF